MNDYLVSIIIPTYNRAHLVADAIRSAQAQDYPHKQLIVVDDGSTDDTRRVVSGFAEVEYCYQPNQGQAAARNMGLRRCRGQYIASLDSDDIWEPDFLSKGVRQLQAGADFVFMNWRASNGQAGLEAFFSQAAAQRHYLTQACGEWWQLTAAQTRRLMLETCPAPSSALLMRRSAMPGGWNEQMLIADDWCLLLDMVLRRPTTAAFHLAPHWLKRVHGQNIYDGRAYKEVARELYAHDEPLFLQQHWPQLSRAEVAVCRQRRALQHFTCAYHNYKQRERADMLHHLAKSFWLAPLTIGHRIAQEAHEYARKFLAKRLAGRCAPSVQGGHHPPLPHAAAAAGRTSQVASSG